ncbi:MAG: dihydrodipicolinate synthase family protein [Anaerolineae bacterium]|nr:dihydrodipicolinate synthase family protein [Anaerolineae bacterium]
MPRYPQTILATCVIPWDEHEQLIEEVFRREIRYLHGQGFDHLYIFGTAGEGYAVDTPHFREIVTVFREETQTAGIEAQVGVMGFSTATVIERLQIAYDAGFRTFQISLPAWRGLNDAELLTYFQDVCGTFPDCSFLHYNLLTAYRTLNAADYVRLVEQMPNLVATKNTGIDAGGLIDLIQQTPELQHFLGEMNFAHGALLGECSLLPSISHAQPDKMKALFAAGQQRDVARLFELQHELRLFTRTVLGPLLAQRRIDGAYDKLLLRLSGFEEMPLRLLSPYQGFSEAEYDACRQRFETFLNKENI